jgi:NAD(P)-dependent dehydrogenase (short-subunit alcohol dehydrogenase family)
MQGKVAAITGAGSGIGAASAAAFGARGAALALIDLSEEAAEHQAELLRHKGATVRTYITDVSAPAAVADTFERIGAELGRLDYAFNNAGIVQPRALLPDIPEDAWDRVLRVNLKSVWLCMKAQLPIMAAQGSGAIVNSSSVGGLIGVQEMAAYSAAKHGVIGLTRTAALEFASKGVRVNAVCPGTIATPLVEESTRGRPELKEAYVAMHPIGRLGTPDEVGQVVAWLCSEEASFITGHALPIEGGRLAQ